MEHGRNLSAMMTPVYPAGMSMLRSPVFSAPSDGRLTLVGGLSMLRASALKPLTPLDVSRPAVVATSADAGGVDLVQVMTNAKNKALRGGLMGMASMVINVCALMWMRTTINYQYRYGGTMMEALKFLYKDGGGGLGGVRRFYRGLAPALVQVRRASVRSVQTRYENRAGSFAGSSVEPSRLAVRGREREGAGRPCPPPPRVWDAPMSLLSVRAPRRLTAPPPPFALSLDFSLFRTCPRQGPLSRFGDTAGNDGFLALMNGLPQTKDLPTAVKTIGASASAAGFRCFLMPVDALKTTLQARATLSCSFLRPSMVPSFFRTRRPFSSSSFFFLVHRPAPFFLLAARRFVLARSRRAVRSRGAAALCRRASCARSPRRVVVSAGVGGGGGGVAWRLRLRLRRSRARRGSRCSRRRSREAARRCSGTARSAPCQRRSSATTRGSSPTTSSTSCSPSTTARPSSPSTSSARSVRCGAARCGSSREP
jgi:hypothetical protein